jgi:hypothetical protein
MDTETRQQMTGATTRNDLMMVTTSEYDDEGTAIGIFFHAFDILLTTFQALST